MSSTSKTKSGSASAARFFSEALLATLALIVATSSWGCASTKSLEEGRDAVFGQAVEASLEEEYATSSAAAYSYLSGSSLEDPRYDRALRLLAEGTEKLGLTYAASLFYLDIARARRDPELVDDAIRGLENIILEYPYEAETVMHGFLARAEITGLPEELQAFLDYQQGLDSLRRGLVEWAQLQFDKIPDDSTYARRAQYALIVKGLESYDVAEVEEKLEELLEESGEDLPDDLRLETHRTLARIGFEQGDYRGALSHYEEVRPKAPDDPALLLEMAWSHYYVGEYERTLGLLTALDAPSYQGLIAPERFLLEALTLKQLCQFRPARRAAKRLRERHGDAIEDLYAGVPLEESEAIRRAARLRGGERSVGAFSRRIRREARMIEDLEGDLGPKLANHLRSIYERGIEENRRLENKKLGDEMETLAEELLAAEEGVRLILHELSVALLRGRQRSGPTPRDYTKGDQEERPVVYKFEHEFWTDELDDLEVRMEDRCIE